MNLSPVVTSQNPKASEPGLNFEQTQLQSQVNLDPVWSSALQARGWFEVGGANTTQQLPCTPESLQVLEPQQSKSSDLLGTNFSKTKCNWGSLRPWLSEPQISPTFFPSDTLIPLMLNLLLCFLLLPCTPCSIFCFAFCFPPYLSLGCLSSP